MTVPSSNKEAIFLWIPKCAGTSVFHILAHYGCADVWNIPHHHTNSGMVTYGHVDLATLLVHGIIDEDYYNRAFKFAFVRNPFDRVVSLYEYLKRTNTGGFPQETTFEEFCSLIEKRNFPPVGWHNHEGMSQCNQMVDWTENVKLDFIGRFENLEADFQVVCDVLGIEATLPHANNGNNSYYKDYYTDKTIDIVERFYQDDLRRFQYEF